MIGWLILGLVLSILTILLFSKIKVHLEIRKDEEPIVSAKYLGFELYKFSEEKKSEENEVEKQKKELKKNKLNLKKYVKTYDDVIELLHSIKNILDKFKQLIRKAVIKNTELELVVVGNDAAATAIAYGAVCSLVYPIVNLLSGCCTFKPEKINVSAGFAEKEMKFSLKTDFSIRAVFLVKFAFSALMEFLRLKKELD